jgi:hypothetical protein
MSDPVVSPDPLAERLSRLEQKLADLTDRPPAPVILAPAGDEPPGLFHPPPVSRALVPVPTAAAPSPWSWAGVAQTLRLIGRMYFDPRYRLSRLAQVGVPVLLLAVVVNYLFWNYLAAVPVLSQVCERLLLVVFAVVLYKLWAAEAVRYKAVLEYLTRYG